MVEDSVRILKEKKKRLEEKSLKTRKVFKIVEATVPYVVSIALGYETFKAVNMTPFAKDNIIENARVEKELDTQEGTSYYEQYEDYNTEKEVKGATISLVEKWSEDKDGSFIRNIKVYDAENTKRFKEEVTIEKLKSIKIDSLENLFGDSILEKTERKNNITEEEKNCPSYLKATIYYEDQNKRIIKKESQFRNIYSTVIFIILSLGLGTQLEKLIVALGDSFESRRRRVINDIEIQLKKKSP